MNPNVHPSESLHSWIPGHVIAVHPERWEVDVQLRYSSGGRVPRCRVVAHWLPEVHREERPSLVLVGWADAYLDGPLAIPVHSFVMPDAQYPDHVYWSEHFGWRIKIQQPGRGPNSPTAPQTGELEIRTTNTKEGPLSIRIQEEAGVIRLDTPDTHIVMRQDAKSIQIIATKDVFVQCENAIVDAGNNIEATAQQNIVATARGGNISVIAPAGVVTVEATAGAVNVKGGAVVNVDAPAINLNGLVKVP